MELLQTLVDQTIRPSIWMEVTLEISALEETFLTHLLYQLVRLLTNNNLKLWTNNKLKLSLRVWTWMVFHLWWISNKITPMLQEFLQFPTLKTTRLSIFLVIMELTLISQELLPTTQLSLMVHQFPLIKLRIKHWPENKLLISTKLSASNLHTLSWFEIWIFIHLKVLLNNQI